MNPNTHITNKGLTLFRSMQDHFMSDDFDTYIAMQICSLLMRHGNSYFHISEMQCNSPDISYNTYRNNPELASRIETRYTEYWDKRDGQITNLITQYVKELSQLTHTDIVIEWNMGVTLRINNRIFYLVD